MSPFIIWTNQRTGGTQLTDWLSIQLNCEVLHEPFNQNRKYSSVTEEFRETQNTKRLTEHLYSLLSEGVSIKICVEEIPLLISSYLFPIASRAGYKHIFLTRENHAHRLRSLALAKKTGRWHYTDNKIAHAQNLNSTPPIDTYVRHQVACNARIELLWDDANTLRHEKTHIKYENLYKSDAVTRNTEITKLKTLLGSDLMFPADILIQHGKSRNESWHLTAQYLNKLDSQAKEIPRIALTRGQIDTLSRKKLLERSQFIMSGWGVLRKTKEYARPNTSNPNENINRFNFDSLLIITYGRSGSTLLSGILNSIDGITINGENYNFCGGLFEGYKSLKKAKQTKSGANVNSTTNPWYGVQKIDLKKYIEDCAQLVRNQIQGKTTDNVYGFKEIRYIEYSDNLNEYLDFLKQVFPRVGFIFNSRSHEKVIASGWWKTRDRNQVKNILTISDKNFIDYIGANENCFHVHHDILLESSKHRKALFDFIGADYKEESVTAILKTKHSY